MTALVLSFLAAVTCAAFVMRSGDLLVAARRAGKGNAAAGKVARRTPRTARPAAGSRGDWEAEDEATEDPRIDHCRNRPPRFPKTPACGLPSGSRVLDMFRKKAESRLRDPGSGPGQQARLWDAASLTACAALGPEDALCKALHKASSGPEHKAALVHPLGWLQIVLGQIILRRLPHLPGVRGHRGDLRPLGVLGLRE
jgi:hypothetical protein